MANNTYTTIDENGVYNNFAKEPQMYVDENVNTGFTKYAEMMNGRFAMIGFVSLLLTEALSGHSFISLLLGQ
ncbi:high light inducible protein [filamentous cyanobacterium LEGE 11480]|uniref:High light inducible protein n=1 Tax=Romeriopsis navalis LEGE 11480 TaxID=2777977 RepID=A0A928VPB0_9CYAN|nr:chlorophyll a/b-binding protein [Romeriopsis navalis]MBE9030386.1 high light inducible protein [Romeriopsis navalis LEGE 11480]